MDYVDPALPREVFGWHSPRLGMHMPIVRYGNWGHPLILYPTAGADLLDCERFYLIKSIEPLLFAGRVTVFAINSVNMHSWMNRAVPVPEAAHRQALYSAYVEEEVVPHIRRAVQNDSARIGVTGASFGAFHATNQFFRRPDLFDTLVAMSGFFDLEGTYTHGFMNDDVYFNNPTSYVPHIHDGHTRDLLSHANIHIVTGQGQWEHPDQSQRFSTLLWNAGIWNDLALWGHDMKHDWPTWRQMLPYYLGEKVGW